MPVIISAVSNDDILNRNLMRSPDVVSGAMVIQERGRFSAGEAYNAGLARAEDVEIAVFVHQDVYLPAGWLARLTAAIEWLETREEPWGVLGVWGVRPDGRMAGRVWCSGGNREHAAPVTQPTEVASIDEVVIVLNMLHDLRFDESLPGFHLYATDIILQARQRGLKAYVIDAPVIHNSRFHYRPVNAAYARAYRLLQRKWANQLPLKTCVLPVTRFGFPLYSRLMRQEVRALLRRGGPGTFCSDLKQLSLQLGYEQGLGVMET